MSRIFIIGDSTVENGAPPFRGWGWALGEYARQGVSIENHAVGGRSSRSFWNEGRFEPVEASMGRGDVLLIQFGHNDEKDDERHTDPHTSFREYLCRYIYAAREKGAAPVLITPVCRRFFSEPTSLMYTHGEYALAVRCLSNAEHVPLCDLKAMSRRLYLSLGPEETARLFVRLLPGEHADFPDGHDDRTHFCTEGARVIAGLVAGALKGMPEIGDLML